MDRVRCVFLPYKQVQLGNKKTPVKFKDRRLAQSRDGETVDEWMGERKSDKKSLVFVDHPRRVYGG